MQILHSVLSLLRRPGVSTSPALLYPMASPPCHWWPPALSRRVFRLMVAPNSPARGISRFPHGSRNMAITCGEKANEPDRRFLASCTSKSSAITQGIIETRGTPNQFIARYGDSRLANGEYERRTDMVAINGDEDDCRTTFEVIDVIAGKHDARGNIVDTSGCEEDRSATMGHTGEAFVSDDDKEDVITNTKMNESSDAPMYPRYHVDDVIPMDILPESRHRDGSIYRATHMWKKNYNIADRTETRFEATMLSDATNCIIRDGICVMHPPCCMLQVFSLKLAKLYVDGGSVELYGYVAARDGLDPLLNYIVNVSRDDPIVVEQGSLINMAGPKRGIDLCGSTLIEFDMRIKTGEQEKDDLQLIDGVSDIDGVALWDRCTFTNRIHGDYGAVDLTASCLEQAVEASVEVVISEVHSSFNLCLICFIRGLNEELKLFDGGIGEPRGLNRSVVAVMEDSWMDLKFKVGAESSSSAEHCCSFKANNHGRATQEIKTGFGLISVKVTWSTLNL
ncbi:uncharacterized protein [Lolium perenne]|uniref:uncharacterized protein n=1 Tax=Lolium perenne TaxID=4522 RepID=UPI0021F501B5|nr:uncharacterized protein LOC127335395 [Lolium perenne]